MRSLSFRALAASALVATLFAPAVARAQQPGPGETEVYREGQFIVFSDAEIPGEKAKKLVERMRDAYSFVKTEQHWADETVLDHDLALRVLSDVHMKEHSKKALGIASGSHTFIMAASFLEKDRSQETIAHELTHLQDRRHLAKGTKLPHYLLEGRAIDMGRAFGAQQKIEVSAHDSRLARTIVKVTGAEAKKMLTEDAYLPEKKIDSVPKMEATGFFFLEFVRTRPGGTAVPTIRAKLAHLVEAVGKGTSFEDAWKAEFDESLADVQAAFFAHMEKTEGKPEDRFKGTVFEGVSLKAPAPTAPAPPEPKALVPEKP